MFGWLGVKEKSIQMDLDYKRNDNITKSAGIGLSSGEAWPTFSLCISQPCICSVEFILGSIPSQDPKMLSVTPSATSGWNPVGKRKPYISNKSPELTWVMC